jgi:hypothetical protein
LMLAKKNKHDHIVSTLLGSGTSPHKIKIEIGVEGGKGGCCVVL